MLEFWIKPFFSVLIWIILQHECCRLVTLKYGPVAALDIFMMFTSGCSIFTTDAVYYYVTTRWVIVLILLPRLKNAFRHVQSIRNKSPLGQHRGFFFSFLIFKTTCFWWNVPDQQTALKTDGLSNPSNTASENDCSMKFQLFWRMISSEAMKRNYVVKNS